METHEIPHPRIASNDEWRALRIELLAKEKELTRQKDRLNAERRRLPMVRLDESYEFDTVDGKRNLEELFEGRRQLIVYHFMFGPDWEKGCPGCTGFVDSLGEIETLHQRNTTFTLVSRAPLEKLLAYRDERKWDVPWASSYGSDFNYDYHVTHEDRGEPLEYNYKPIDAAKGGEAPGISVFFRLDGEVFHTYSAFARGVESLTDSYALLDITPYGRQEDWEDSPDGWPQSPTYG